MTSYLDYYKSILTKVSFDPRLFNKEYCKAARYLHPGELNDLNDWLASTGFHNILTEELGPGPIGLYDRHDPHRQASWPAAS